MNTAKRYFVDMDGVLAEFRTEAAFSDLYRRNFYRSLRPLQPALDAYRKMAEAGEEIYILSCYLADSMYALNEKKAWVNEYLPGANCLFIPYGSSKATAIMQMTGNALSVNDILIDDHSPNLNMWEKAGGKAIKYLNGINGAGKNWKGCRTSGDFSHLFCKGKEK